MTKVAQTNSRYLRPGAGFAVEEAGDHFWICDGGQRVLLFIRMPGGGFYCNAVFLQPPDAPAPEFPESYHSATAIGLQADIRWRWGTDWKPMERSALELDDRQAIIAFTRHSVAGRNEQAITLTLRRSGAGPADYVLHGHSVLLGDTPPGLSIEFLNFLPANAGHSAPDRKRFRETVHEWEPGKFERRPHSPLTVIEAYYWPDSAGFRRPQVPEPAFAEVFDPALRARGEAAPFAVSHLYKPMAQGGVLFFAGEEITPAVRVIRSNAPLVVDTCDVWYDEHLCLARGVPESDGRWRYEVDYEIFNLASAPAALIAANAATTVLSAWSAKHEFAPFFLDRPNHFTTPVGREYDGATGMFFAYENPAHLVSWQRRTNLPARGAIVLNTVEPVEPPSGQYYQSVRYDLGGPRPWVEAFPLGFSLHVDRGETMEFSALIRTEGVASAWLEMREAFWGKYQREQRDDFVPQIVKTLEIRSASWVRVEGCLTAQIPGSLSMIYLSASGKGRAWFTELLVRPLRLLASQLGS